MDNQYSLSDDRRVRVLSPGMLVAKRFFRNRLAVTGMVVLVAMFIFSFIGGLLTPYAQDQKFYRSDVQAQDYAGVIRNEEFRYTVGAPDLFKSSVHPQAYKAILEEKKTFDYNGNKYLLKQIGEDVYTVASKGDVVGIVSRELVNSSTEEPCPFSFVYAAFTARAEGKDTFESDGMTYSLGEDGVITDADGNETAYISDYIVKAVMGDVFFSREFKEELIGAVEAGETHFAFTGEDGETAEYSVV